MQNPIDVDLVHENDLVVSPWKNYIEGKVQGSRVKLIKNMDEWDEFARDVISRERSCDVIIFHQGFSLPRVVETMVEVVRSYIGYTRIGIESGGAAEDSSEMTWKKKILFKSKNEFFRRDYGKTETRFML